MLVNNDVVSICINCYIYRGSAPWQAGTPPGQGPPPGWGQNGPVRSQTLDGRGSGGRVPPPVRPKPQMRPQSSYQSSDGPDSARRGSFSCVISFYNSLTWLKLNRTDVQCWLVTLY